MTARKRGSPDQVPFEFMVPESDWVAPVELPDLVSMGVKIVGLDLETKDDGLAAERGAGWATGAGWICGVGVAWDGGSLYVPIRHMETACMEPERVRAWLNEMIRGGVTFVTQHGSYDWGWLGAEWGLKVPSEQVEDVHAAAVMLDENRLSYSLSSLCLWQGLPGKDERLLREAASALGVDPKSGLWRLPGRFVGPYGAADPVSTLGLWRALEPQLEAEGLREAYRLEADLIPCTVAMRARGIRIDTGRAEGAREELRGARDRALEEAGRLLGRRRAVTIDDVLSPRWLVAAFGELGLGFGETAKGNPSFVSDDMMKSEHPFPRAVETARYYQMIEDKFIRGFILDYCHRGRLHPEIHQLRDADELGARGTRSYRYSYSDPPLQQMPNPKRPPQGAPEAVRERVKFAGGLIRKCFLPEEGKTWGRCDYHSQEFRLMVHFAALLGLPRADEVVGRYRADARTDFHTVVAEMTGLPRPAAKDANFAKAFGAGVRKFAAMTGRPEEEAEAIMKQYDEEFPFIKRLAGKCEEYARVRGWVRLVDGARCRFDRWEPASWRGGSSGAALPRSAAEEKWPETRLKRAFTHKAMNRLIQGSAARQTKLAMRSLWKSGIIPLLQMHDEINQSLSSPEEGQRLVEIMEGVVRLEIPVVADLETGASWGG